MCETKNSASVSLIGKLKSIEEIKNKKLSVLSYLNSHSFDLAEIIKIDENAITLDLSQGADLFGVPVSGLSVDEFSDLIERKLQENKTDFAFGRWAENRGIYSNDLFDSNENNEEKRSIHMGIDVFCEHRTKIFSPLDGVVHIIGNNRTELDYGPLIIIKHRDNEDNFFYTLYGHLDSQSMKNINMGDEIKSGQLIAEVGAPPENGNWPPHLHFQLILDLLDLDLDFPGVAFPSEKEIWLTLSPCPIMFFPNAQKNVDSTRLGS